MAKLNWRKVRRYFLGTNISALFTSILSLLLILFIIYNWNEISVLQIGNNYVKKMDKTKNEVFAAASTVKKLKIQTEEMYLKTTLINQIYAIALKTLDQQECAPKASELLVNYKTGKTAFELRKILIQYHCWTREIDNSINNLEEFEKKKGVQ